MDFEHVCIVPAQREALWDTLMDVHRVASCIEGVRDLEIKDEDHFAGTLEVKMGPMRLAFLGTVTVTARDRASWTASLLAAGKDRKAGGGFNAELTMRLADRGADETALQVTLSTSLSGRIAQMGRPLVKKRVQNMLEDFATALAAGEAGRPREQP